MSIVIVFAAGDPPPPQVAGDLPVAQLVVAANGGLEVARTLGHPVDIVIGDLDSVDRASLPDHVVIEEHPRDKDATDLELAMARVAGDAPERIVVVGGSGGRLDHELAVAGVICSERWAEVDEIDWISGRGRAHVVRGARRLHGDIGATMSLLAMGGPATGVTTRGLFWELADDVLAPDAARGVSNRLVAPVVEIRVGSGTLLAVFPDG